ncbi:MAG: hypothetical protein ACRDV4_04845, partial [Acidimicrobiales bacterium]
FKPVGSGTWSDDVEATAVATNGGLVLSSSGSALVVGVRPSNLLRFSPLVSTQNGRSWSSGLLPEGLADRPGALASNSSGGHLALVEDGNRNEVLSTDGGLSSWRSLVTERQLASSQAGLRCGVEEVSAVGYLAQDPLVGTSCSRAGVAGLFVEGSGGWRLAGPRLSSPAGSKRTEVLSIEDGSGGPAVLLGLARGSRTSVVEATRGAAGTWTISQPVAVAPARRLVSFGPVTGAGFFVTLAEASGTESVDVVGAGGDSVWERLPQLPAHTSTVSFAPTGDVEAFVAHGSKLEVWDLDRTSHAWMPAQTLTVQIVYGSSQ